MTLFSRFYWKVILCYEVVSAPEVIGTPKSTGIYFRIRVGSSHVVSDVVAVSSTFVWYMLFISYCPWRIMLPGGLISDSSCWILQVAGFSRRSEKYAGVFFSRTLTRNSNKWNRNSITLNFKANNLLITRVRTPLPHIFHKVWVAYIHSSSSVPDSSQTIS